MKRRTVLRKYKVNEIFGNTIQGEGANVGLPVSFLRFSGCNKWSGKPEHKAASICSFCDTDFLSYTEMSANEIVNRLKHFKSFNIVLSGGEPLLQLDMELISALRESKFKLFLETNGSLALGERRPYFSWISCSPKQSAERTKIEYVDELKFLFPYIGDDIAPEHFGLTDNIYIQPIEGAAWEINQQEVVNLVNKNNWRMSFQAHKLLNLQ